MRIGTTPAGRGLASRPSPPAGPAPILPAGLALLGWLAAGCGDPVGPGPAGLLTSEHVIAFVGVRPEDPDVANLYAVRADGSGEVRLTRDEGIHPDWSPDGSRIVFQRQLAGEFALFTLNADGTGERRITDLGSAAGLGRPSAEHPDWSPDGRRIAFISKLTGRGDLYLVNADGTGLAHLLETPQPELAPDWHPDGIRILFERADGQGTEIWYKRVDAPVEVRLTAPLGHDMGPQWSPDGRRVVFSRYLYSERNSDIYVMEPDGGNVTRLTSGPASDAEPTWAPDGERILFVRRSTGGDARLHVMDADGSGLRLLSPGPGDFTTPTWRALAP